MAGFAGQKFSCWEALFPIDRLAIFALGTVEGVAERLWVGRRIKLEVRRCLRSFSFFTWSYIDTAFAQVLTLCPM